MPGAAITRSSIDRVAAGAANGPMTRTANHRPRQRAKT
nr:MAG TPA: hypothetical protein [Caudoviricetes sp.]